MCYIRETSYACGHVRKDVVGGPCAASLKIDEQRQKWARPNTPHTEKKCIEYFDSDERVFEDKECGAGGSFMNCVERQSLDDYQARVLRLCEVREQTTCTKLAEQADRISEVTEKFRPDFWGRTTATVEFQLLIEKANEEVDVICRKLGYLIRHCGQLIVRKTDTTRQDDDTEKMMERCASIIGHWEITHLARLKEVANALEMEGRKPENLSMPKLGKDFDPKAGDERSMDLLFREIRDQDLGKPEPVQPCKTKAIAASSNEQIDRSGDMANGFDIDIWGD